MKAFMTNGTLHFLKKYEQKYKGIKFHLMANPMSALIYYEKENKNIFQSGRAYDIVLNSGEIADSGYVVMNNIPVARDSRSVFEDRFKKRQAAIDYFPGFQAFRLLRPKKGDTYVVLTHWATKKDYDLWKTSDAFKHSHNEKNKSRPTYYIDKPFITTYFIITDEE